MDGMYVKYVQIVIAHIFQMIQNGPSTGVSESVGDAHCILKGTPILTVTEALLVNGQPSACL